MLWIYHQDHHHRYYHHHHHHPLPSGEISTISPGRTSRKNFAPIEVKAQDSEETTQPSTPSLEPVEDVDDLREESSLQPLIPSSLLVFLTPLLQPFLETMAVAAAVAATAAPGPFSLVLSAQMPTPLQSSSLLPLGFNWLLIYSKEWLYFLPRFILNTMGAYLKFF